MATPFANGGGGVTGWETLERVLESGGFESRQRVLVAEPAVEASEAGARALGVTYWQAVDRFSRGCVRASWTGRCSAIACKRAARSQRSMAESSHAQKPQSAS